MDGRTQKTQNRIIFHDSQKNNNNMVFVGVGGGQGTIRITYIVYIESSSTFAYLCSNENDDA